MDLSDFLEDISGDDVDTPSPVVRGILGYIRTRNLHPGDRLPSERAFAEQLGVGRNALREGLATLATLRIIEMRPNSGIYLRPLATESSFEALVMLAELGSTPTASEIAETMEVRAALELMAVKLSCMRREESDLADLREILAESERVLLDHGNIVDVDTAFHLALVSAAHNTVLVRVLNAFYRFTARRRRALFSGQEHARASIEDHKNLYEAIAARDIDGGQELIRRHMDRARFYWHQVIGSE
jgi:GntR family transcriptional regulator, transcriptional repressor for pyruvate dehydrogenase complex